jgi:hypothetical protein
VRSIPGLSIALIPVGVELSTKNDFEEKRSLIFILACSLSLSLALTLSLVLALQRGTATSVDCLFQVNDIRAIHEGIRSRQWPGGEAFLVIKNR